MAPGGAVKVKTYFPNVWWWPRPNMGEDAVVRALVAMRERIASTGAALTRGMPEPPPRDAVYTSDDEDGFSASDGEDVFYDGPGGWPLVGRLGWCLRSDGVLEEAAVRRVLGHLGRGGRRDELVGFLHERELELAAGGPHLASKSRAQRLQFAALGREWFAALRGSPTLADYLEGEAQAIDLEAVLG